MAETKQDQRDGFLFYRSYYEAAKTLKKREREAFFMAVCAYSLDGEEPELPAGLQTAWTLVKPVLVTNRRRYLNGKSPKRKKGDAEAKPEQTESEGEAKPKQTGSVASPLSDRQETEGQEIKDKKDEGQETRDKGQENGAAAAGEAAEGKKTVCSSGLLSEIKAFVLSCGGSEAQGQAFFDQYEKAGWMAGGRPVENWQGLCRNWLRCSGGEGKKPASAPPACSAPTADSAGYRVPPSARRNARQLLRLLEEDAG